MINKILEKSRSFGSGSVRFIATRADLEIFLRQSIVEVLKKLREDIAENRPINMREEITHNTYSDGKRDLADKLLSTITSEIESIK